MRRPALAKPNAQLALEHRRRAELRRHDELGGLEQEVEVAADVVLDLLLRRTDGDVVAVARLELVGDVLDDRVISDSVTQAPWTRIGLLAPMGRKSASPWPMSFSAPGWSRTTRESVTLEVAKAIREGTLALMRPVTTSTLVAASPGRGGCRPPGRAG